MLKIILGITGVVFIGLGVFGGQLLESFTERFPDQMANGQMANAQMANAQMANAQMASVEAPSTNVIVAENASAKVASVMPQNDGPQNDGNDATSVTTSAAAAVQQTKAVVTPVATAVASANSDATVVKETEATEVVAVASAGEVAEPMAPAQAAGDLVAMTEQAKSSSRNEQVNLAETILTSSKPPVEAVAKSTEVDAVMVATTGELSNEILVVSKDKVNLRDGPSIDHPIVLTLEQGQELMEFKREGKWVHVGAYGTSGKIGWVHQRLVSSATN